MTSEFMSTVNLTLDLPKLGVQEAQSPSPSVDTQSDFPSFKYEFSVKSS